MIPATLNHVEEISTTARGMDRLEVLYQSGLELKPALELSYRISSECWAGFADERLVTVFGVGATAPLDGIGAPWMIATPELERLAIPFLRRNWYYLNRMKMSYPVLTNVVYAENDVSIRWLTWMGFEMGEIELYGPQAKPFRRFSWGAV